MPARWVRWSVGMVCLWLAVPALAADGLRWSRDPDRVPWETMTTVADHGRSPARTLADIEERRSLLQSRIDSGRLDRPDQAAALVEMGDLFRDEARLVLQRDAVDPWRVPLETTSAWLQLELALDWYERAMAYDAELADPEGRLTLLRSVTLQRLGRLDQAWDGYVTVLRTTRGTPWVEMAKAAVGDAHVRRTRNAKARQAYRLVRGQREPEIGTYARFRLAHLAALDGLSDEAIATLQELVGEAAPSPLLAMIADASRTALANHLAERLPLDELVAWSIDQCAEANHACHRDLREAAAETFERNGQDREAAWLRTLGAAALLRGRPDDRLALTRIATEDLDPDPALVLVEGRCDQVDDSCRADLAFELSGYFEAAGRPDGAWIRQYLLLPKLPGRPELNRELGRIARDEVPVEQAVARFDAACDEDRSCLAKRDPTLRRVLQLTNRERDARWLAFRARPPEVPGGSRAAAVMAEIVRNRASAREALDRLEPLTGDDAEAQQLRRTLVQYYDAIGLEDDSAWLLALDFVESTDLGNAPMVTLREVARESWSVGEAVAALAATCEVVDTACLRTFRGPLEVVYQAARRGDEAWWVQQLAVLYDLPVPPEAFPAVLGAFAEDVPGVVALQRAAPSCRHAEVEREQMCTDFLLQSLMGWYGHLDRLQDLRMLREALVSPQLASWPEVQRALLEVVEQTADPLEALTQLAKRCPADDTETCRRATVSALANHYERLGRPAAANRVRTAPDWLLDE